MLEPCPCIHGTTNNSLLHAIGVLVLHSAHKCSGLRRGILLLVNSLLLFWKSPRDSFSLIPLSYDILYCQLDKLLLLSEGHVMYFGKDFSPFERV
jgi:hypothetical protein